MPNFKIKTHNTALYLFFGALYFAVFCFGAVHARSFCLLSTLFCMLYLLVPAPYPQVQPGMRIPSLFFLGSAFLAVALFVCSSSTGLLNSMNHLVAFIAAWCVCSYSFYLSKEHRLSFHIYVRVLSLGGIAVATLSLAHSANDTGLYLGYFAPEHVFASQRTRWPFVNANHLGHFLIVTSMVTWCDLYLSNFKLVESVRRRKNRKKPFIFFTSERIWKRFRVVLFLGLGHCLQALALFLTFSRSAYIGYTVSVAVALLLPLFYRSPWPRLFRAIILLPYALSTLCLLLFAKVRLVFIDRMLFMEESIQQDLRQELWNQAVPLLSLQHWLGLGPNGWRSWHLVHAPSLSAHFDPYYLHSDPFQYLIEYGLPGCFLLLVFLSVLCYCFFRSLQKGNRQSTLSIFLFAGLLGLGLASFFDFPFHIPAIQWWTVCILGLLCSLLSSDREAHD